VEAGGKRLCTLMNSVLSQDPWLLSALRLSSHISLVEVDEGERRWIAPVWMAEAIKHLLVLAMGAISSRSRLIEVVVVSSFARP
jgi:hypothetical protein